MINPKNIVKSLFIDGESLPQWREDRLSKCSTCPYNSKNVENKNIFRKGYQAIGGAHCLICNCILENKTKIAEEACPKGFWEAQEITEKNKKIDIEVLSKEMITLYYEKDIPILDYGIIKHKSNSAINIQILTNKYLETSIRSTCGCTIPKLKENDKGYLLNITYDTKRLGAFTKSINITFINKGVQDKLTLKITGNVTNN